MLPGFRQLPESATKDWHGPEDEEPRYAKGMRASIRANAARAALQGVRAAVRGYGIGVTTGAVAVATIIPGAMYGRFGWLTAALGALALVVVTARIVGAFLTMRKEAAAAQADATTINAEVERNMRVLPETEEDRETPAAPAELPGTTPTTTDVLPATPAAGKAA